MSVTSRFLTYTSIALVGGLFISALPTTSANAGPSLVITDKPLPQALRNAAPRRLYSDPRPVQAITKSQVLDSAYYDEKTANTIVNKKLVSLQKELNTAESILNNLSETLYEVQTASQERAADYYANVATISAQLQSGTTPGNPRLVRRLKESQSSLDTLATTVARLNDIAVESANLSAMSSFLLESTRATYGLSGAIEEDHVQLAKLEDSVNAVIVMVDRLLNNVNDDISRTSNYLANERNNLRTLAYAVTNGDLYGKALSNRPFSSIPFQQAGYTTPQGEFIQAAPAPQQPQALAIIKFTREDINYEQAVYAAVQEALGRYPNAQFELVAVTPTQGNAARVAIETTRARRNAERVLRSLVQMGMQSSNVQLSAATSVEAQSNEVHLYVR